MSTSVPLSHTGHSTKRLWSSVRPFVALTRLHKFPAGSDLAFWPSAWGVLLCARVQQLHPQTVAIMLAMYLLGSTLGHSAGCIWNDICDREFDKQVERSKTRPLASGAVSLSGAVKLLLAMVAVCYGILTLAGPEGTKVGLIGLLVLDPIYPLMKRWTYWPQAILGFAMSWGLPTAWISMRGYTDLDALAVLLIGCVCWAIYYDTIYACQDRRDDVKAGVKSTAVLFGSYVRPILAAFAATFVGSLYYAGQVTGAGIPYYLITIAGSALCFAQQLLAVDFDNGADCWNAFKANGTSIGFVIWFGMVADYLANLSWA